MTTPTKEQPVRGAKELVARLRRKSLRYQIGSEWGHDLREAATLLERQAETMRKMASDYQAAILAIEYARNSGFEWPASTWLPPADALREYHEAHHGN